MTWEHVAFVESDSTPGKEYEIKKRSDGVRGCSCHAYRFAPGTAKTCKHIDVWQVSGGVVDTPIFRQRLAQPSAPVRGAQVAGETFTFRRAISFTPLTARSRP